MKGQTARLEARLPLDVHIMLKRAAEIQGRSLTDFVVTAAADAAKRAIEDAEVIRLSVEAQQQIFDSLMNPPEPSEGLRRAVARYEELIGPAK